MKKFIEQNIEKKKILVHKIMITFLFVYMYLFLNFLRCCKDWYLCHIYTWWIWLYLRQQSVNLHVYCKLIWLKLWCNSLSWVIVIKSFYQSVCHSQPGLDILFVCSYMYITNFVYEATHVYIYLVNVVLMCHVLHFIELLFRHDTIV